MVGQQFRVAVGGPAMHHGPLGGLGGGKVEELGAFCSPVFDDFVRTQLGDGVMVHKVSKDSVGQRIGLERHDLIKSVNGTDVANVEDLQTALENAGLPPTVPSSSLISAETARSAERWPPAEEPQHPKRAGSIA